MRLTKSELDEILKKNKGITICESIDSNDMLISKPISEFKAPKILSFTVPGIPVPAPRQTQRDKWMKRPCVMRYREYGARLHSFINLHDMYVGKITGIFYIPMPKSWSKKKKAMMLGKPHRQRGDWDNFMKGVQDLLLKNDAMIWAGYGETRWEDEKGPRTELTFETTE